MNEFLLEYNNVATTENGALSNKTSGSEILDYFSKCGTYRGRSQEEVNQSMEKIFSENRELAMKVVLYNRMITREIKVQDSKISQSGQGQKDEFVKSLKWIETHYPDILFKNLWLIPVVGSWKDLWYDSPVSKIHNYVNFDKVSELIKVGLQYEQSRGLIAKFLPTIRSQKAKISERQKRMNHFARSICRNLGWTEKSYRKFKSDPENKAHDFQRKMCSKDWDSLNFDQVPGRAVSKILNMKGKDGKSTLERHGLESRFLEWLMTKEVVNFTGYPFELYNIARTSNLSKIQEYTLDKQFEKLLSLTKVKKKKNIFCALDTSGSMESFNGDFDYKFKPIDVCVGLGIFFSSLNVGTFKDHVVMFDNTSKILKLEGSFCDKVKQVKKFGTAWGSTNFQSVIDEIVRIRKHNPQIEISDYPEMLLVVSDMQFNPGRQSEMTNYQEAVQKLKSVGLRKMEIVWWNVNGHSKEVPSKISDNGTTLISGFDGSIISLLLEGENVVKCEKTGEVRKLNPFEQMLKVLDQKTLNCVQV